MSNTDTKKTYDTSSAANGRVGSGDLLAPSGVELIAAERARQISQEGWTSEHDDDHGDGQMADAAGCYALAPHHRAPTISARIPGNTRLPEQRVRVPARWPWDAEWWKPCPEDRVRELVKAGALIAAEIDRLNRANIPREPDAQK